MIAPSAAAFALVALAAAVMAIGRPGRKPHRPGGDRRLCRGGRDPAGAGGDRQSKKSRCCLSCTAPMPPGCWKRRRRRRQAPLDPNAPFNSLARAAIGAAHQGVFDLDFRAGLLTLSPEAAQMVGLSAHEDHACRTATGWRHVHPEDREVYTGALEEYRDRPGLAFRLEFRARGGRRPYRWLELRATIVSEQDVPSDCLGLISDITQRKEAEFAAIEAETSARKPPAARSADRAGQPRGADGGAGRAGRELCQARCSRCWTWTASRPSMPAWATAAADTMLTMMADAAGGAWANRRRFSASAATVLPCCLPTPTRRPGHRQRAGRGLRPALSAGRPQSLRALPASAWRTAAQSEDPLALIKNAELALIAAKRQGGACARLYVRRAGNTGAAATAWRWKANLRHALDARPARCLLSADHAAGRPQRGGLRGAAALASSRQGPDRARRFHRPFRRERPDRRAGPFRAGARRDRPGALAALFSA